MPRFYFDLYDNDQLTTDDEGIELSSLSEAHSQVQTMLPDIARDTMPDSDRRDLTVIVKGSNKCALFRITLSMRTEWIDSLTPSLRTPPSSLDNPRDGDS